MLDGELIDFRITSRSSGNEARRAELVTRHGTIQTPVFMPVGTLACVKALDSSDLSRLNAKIILNNAYHLMLRPGAELVDRLGGLHRFMAYDGAILTDSGGFQVFSLADLRNITDEGVTFRSHIDGSPIQLSPEKLVEVQEYLFPDIAMMLDECPPGKADRDTVQRAMRRTTAWAKRCLNAQKKAGLAWFGIVQGGTYDDLRTVHAQEICELPFDGFAIGGVSVGEHADDIDRVVRLTAPLLPVGRPRYLMGVGTPEDLVRGVAAGVDMFDCVMPTRNARNGNLFTSRGRIIIKNAAHRDATEPVDEACPCYVCKTFTRAYLRHLYVAGELSYFRLATLHNLTFYLNLMQRIREAIEADRFVAKQFLDELAPGDGVLRHDTK